MWYWILDTILALWILIDSMSRRMRGSSVVWAAGTLLLGPILCPVYFAVRPLKAGEVREGGRGWNVLKNFALLWTLFMAVAAIAGLVNVAQQTRPRTSDAEMAGAAIGTALGLGMIAALWFFPMVGAVVFGFILKKNSIVERGPTGPLAATQTPPTGSGAVGA